MNRATKSDGGLTANREAREAALNGARRRLVLDGAWRVFARDGLDGATLRGIAAEAGCTTGAIYPLFASKEIIYAALLAESLDKLHADVAGAIATIRDPAQRVSTAARAFLFYYRDRPDEVALGLYLWRGLKPRGLTRPLDTDLNARLAKTLDILRDALRTLGRLDPATARLEASALFAFLIGALVVYQTGRLRLLETAIDDMVDVHVSALVKRLKA